MSLVHGRPPGPSSSLGLLTIVAVLVLDQGGKWLATKLLALAEPVPFLPVLTFFRTENTGVAFSFFGNAGPAILIVVTAVIGLLVLLLWSRAQDGGRLAAFGYGLIVGGAAGNLIDRVLHGHVIDFLFLHLGSRPLFVFNLADVALTIGPALLVVLYLLMPRRQPEA
jgi:signal peptidase II